jgi:hypothetical protein
MFLPCNKTVTVYPWSSNNGYDDVYGTGVSVSCYWEKIQRIVNSGNQQFLTSAFIQFPAGTPVTKKDRIVLSDGDTGAIVSFYSGDICIEIWLGEAQNGGF